MNPIGPLSTEKYCIFDLHYVDDSDVSIGAVIENIVADVAPQGYCYDFPHSFSFLCHCLLTFLWTSFFYLF